MFSRPNKLSKIADGPLLYHSISASSRLHIRQMHHQVSCLWHQPKSSDDNWWICQLRRRIKCPPENMQILHILSCLFTVFLWIDSALPLTANRICRQRPSHLSPTKQIDLCLQMQIISYHTDEINWVLEKKQKVTHLQKIIIISTQMKWLNRSAIDHPHNSSVRPNL